MRPWNDDRRLQIFEVVALCLGSHGSRRIRADKLKLPDAGLDGWPYVARLGDNLENAKRHRLLELEG